MYLQISSLMLSTNHPQIIMTSNKGPVLSPHPLESVDVVGAWGGFCSRPVRAQADTNHANSVSHGARVKGSSRGSSTGN